MAVTGGSCMAGATANGNGNGGEDNVWPPGIRFHPTDEELVLYYLKRKICKRKLKLDIIREIDVYKWDPEELPGQSLLKTGDRQWFFFSPRDRKYPNGARSNRATRQGYWKATGKDRTIACNSRSVGLKKTLVFYRGRAPSGGRTDWVMHEYTLDEEELSRCPNVQDYYALYKVFKKSGPGPKNGEQYGAPFKEEDWVDDECADANNSNTVDTSAKQLVEAAPDNSDKIIVPVEQSVDELGELLKQFVDVPELGLPLLNDDTYLKPKVVCGEQTQSTVVDSVVTEVTYVEPLAGLPPNGQQQGQEVSFDFCQVTASLQPDGGPEAIFALNNHVEEAQLSLKDYLEMDDFLESKPAFTNVEGPGEDLQFGGFDEHHELNMYHDADMFLRDVGQIDQGTVFYPQTNSPGIEMENQVGYQSQAYSIGSQGFTQLQSHLVASEMNFQIQPGSFAGEQISDQLRIHDEASCVLSSPEFQGTLSQLAPGVEYGVMGSRPGANQNLSSEQGTSTSSRFASSMWSFLESIPSHPASASESPSVNKAFERMSSFSRLRMNAKSPVVNTESGAANARKAGVNRPFLLLSILGALCAMLWVVLTGTEKVLGRRSVSS